MENVLINDYEIKGFIDPNGILIRIANLELGEDPVEIVAESIIRDVERSKRLDFDILSKKKKTKHFFRQYLVENYYYIYIHISYLDDKVEITEIIAPNHSFDISSTQKKKIISLCKQTITAEEIPKFLEKQRKYI